ncbi:MAG: potassium/proton antiporter [Bacteroidales bacterium]|nr:potassium/proton antiporter [Bacteroidales bacterium]MDD4821939.1 potassium/proton antiporter [Bacteroidales bacterium]
MDLVPGNIILIGSMLLFLSVIAGKAGYRFGVPALLLFLGLGMLFGTDGILGLQFNNPKIAQFIGTLALTIILFSGGMDTKKKEVRPIMAPGIVLATLGVVCTTVITGYFIYYLTNFFGKDHIAFSLMESMLLAATMSSTDSASVFSILRSRGLGLKENLRPMLELESGSNDPMAYLLTLLFIQIIQIGDASFAESAKILLIQLSLGTLLGYLIGRLAVYVINHINVSYTSFYSLLMMAFAFFTFSFTDFFHGNGYLAVYIAGFIVGNNKLVHKRTMATFFDGLTWLSQIVMFLTLGLLVNPKELISIAGIGMLVAFFMIIVARPFSVFFCLLPFRKFSTSARCYISWVGLRGAVPIIFATYPWIEGINHAHEMFNIVFFITLVSLLVQGMTVGPMARWLGVSKPPEKEKEFDLVLPDEIKSAMSEVEVNPVTLENGNRMMDLTLPANTLVAMVKRSGLYFVPTGKTLLKEGDKLLIISDNDEELKEAFANLGIKKYSIEKN